MIARGIVLWALTVAVLAGSLPIPGDHDSLESTVQRLVQQKLHGAQPHAWRQEDAATRAARIRRAYARLIDVASARRGFRLRHALLAAVAERLRQGAPRRACPYTNAAAPQAAVTRAI